MATLPENTVPPTPVTYMLQILSFKDFKKANQPPFNLEFWYQTNFNDVSSLTVWEQDSSGKYAESLKLDGE